MAPLRGAIGSDKELEHVKTTYGIKRNAINQIKQALRRSLSDPLYAIGAPPVVQLVDIERFAPGVAHLSKEEQEALQNFTLLWTLFEAQVLESGASVQKIAEIIQGLDPNLLDGGWFNEHLEYFKNRYIEDGKINYRFEHLHLRKNDNPELVRAVLVGENQELVSQLIACLAIVYRFRNNFFHGIKWAYGIQGQYDNFAHATALLAKCLERFPHGI